MTPLCSHCQAAPAKRVGRRKDGSPRYDRLCSACREHLRLTGENRPEDNIVTLNRRRFERALEAQCLTKWLQAYQTKLKSGDFAHLVEGVCSSPSVPSRKEHP